MIVSVLGSITKIDAVEFLDHRPVLVVVDHVLVAVRSRMILHVIATYTSQHLNDLKN